MKFFATSVAATTFFSSIALAQTSSKCDPIKGQQCPNDPALSGTKYIDFTSGSSSDFTPQTDGITYDSNGAQMAVAAHGDSPTLQSNWYLMFGHVDFVVKTAPGTGMVSSCILISDDLDEVDWEILGAYPTQAQTNYFGKGITGDYDRGETITSPDSQTEWTTYSIDWTADRIEWLINGQVKRTLTPGTADPGQYPQTPMHIRVGSWAAGDPSNPPGTITWSGGKINYADGPYVMQVKSIRATDYSTGSAYQYSGTDGSWQQVKAIGGTVNPDGHAPGGPPTVDPPTSSSDPAPTSVNLSHGTHRTPDPKSDELPWQTEKGGVAHATNAPPASSGFTLNDPPISHGGKSSPTHKQHFNSPSSAPSVPSSQPVHGPGSGHRPPVIGGGNGGYLANATASMITVPGGASRTGGVNPTNTLGGFHPGPNVGGRVSVTYSSVLGACVLVGLGALL